MANDIFISHAQKDTSIAVQIANGLEESGYTTWYYERDSFPGPSYLEQVEQAIAQSKVIVLVISQDSLSSPQVNTEIVRAHESGKNFMPILCGLTHREFQIRKPAWRMALGAATSVIVPEVGISAILPRIIQGLKAIGIEPQRVPDTSMGMEKEAATYSSDQGNESTLTAKVPPNFENDSIFVQENEMKSWYNILRTRKLVIGFGIIITITLYITWSFVSRNFEPNGDDIMADVTTEIDTGGTAFDLDT